MNGTALVIVLASAFLHAGWNYLLKKSDIIQLLMVAAVGAA
jgi:hypothetical protein